MKVQYPRAEHYFRIDMKTIKGFCRLAFPEQVPLMEEIERQFLTEFDYKEEARLMRTAADNLAPTFGREVRVPLPIDASHPASALPGGMCTTSVLTDGAPPRPVAAARAAPAPAVDGRRRGARRERARGRAPRERARASSRCDAARDRNLGVRDLLGRARRVRERAHWHAQYLPCVPAARSSRT